MRDETGRPQVRLAELIAALSLGVDLGFGQPMEHALRQCLIALRLAERRGLDDGQRAAVYYSALLVSVGCHTDAHEQARWFGDDIALKSDKYAPHGLSGFRAMLTGMRRIGSGQLPLARLRTAVSFAAGGYRELDGMVEQHAALAQELGGQLGLPEPVLEALGASYEQWDGHGWPGRLSGEAVPIASRIAQLAEFVEVAHREAGTRGALAVAVRRSGSQFDPALVECLRADPEGILGNLDGAWTWDRVIAAEPSLAVGLEGDRFDEALASIADFVDLKSPYTLGHARAVADLAAAAASNAGLSDSEAQTLRRAGLVHDLGRLGVSNAIWDKPGPLSAGEMERVRLHPYYSERMLRQSPGLAQLGQIAVQHHERMDGSGYPHGLPGSAISTEGRILGAADAYQTLREPRPHRPTLSAPDAAARLRSEVRAGRLDADAVEAVLLAAGHRVRRTHEGLAGLTAREVEVLRLVARGLSNREIADALTISPKTAGHHVEHVYEKIGASNRAAASFFAVRHGLIQEEVFPCPP